MSFADIKYLIIQSFKEWQADKASQLAAALSYFTVFSIPPLLTIALAIAGYLFGRQVARQEVLQQSRNLLGETGAEAIQQILENASQSEANSLMAIVGVAVLLFGASGVFMRLQEAMNIIWNVEPPPNQGFLRTIKDRFLSFSMVVGVGFLLLVSLIVSSVLAAVYNYISSWEIAAIIPIARVFDTLFSFVIVTLLFTLIFKVIPDVEIRWRDVWPGAIVTAVLFTIGEWALSFYLGNMAPTSTYGAAGSLIVLLLWVYYSAQILFLGAEFTQVYAHKYGPYNLPTIAKPGTPDTSAPPHEPDGPVVAAGTGVIANRYVPVHTAPQMVGRKTKPGKAMQTYNRYVIMALAIPVMAWQFMRRLTRPNTAPPPP